MQRAPKSIQEVPGQSNWWVAGSFFDMRKEPLAFFEAYARKYGNLCRFRAFHSFILLNDASLLREVFIDQSRALKRSRRAHEIKVALGNGLVVSDGEIWRVVRQALLGEFHPQRFLTRKGPLAEVIEKRAKAWERRGVISLRTEIARLTLDISSHVFFGIDLSKEEDEISDALETVNREFAEVLKSWIPLPLYVPSPGRMRVRRSYRVLAGVAQRILAKAESQPSDCTAWVRKMQAMCEEAGLPKGIVLDQIIFLLMASYDTTAVAITYTIWLLSLHKSLQNELAESLAAKAGQPGAEAFVKPILQEAMRLYPPVWGIGREAASEIRIGDYSIPAGTQILTLPYIVHRDARNFDFPNEFRPERFRDGELARDAYFPFGIGPQACMGSHFATVEAIVIIKTLIPQYEFLADSAQYPGSSLGITLRPKNDFIVRVAKRSRAFARCA